MDLTKKQQIIYDFICSYNDENGFPPTIREICDGVGLKSTATVFTHIENLKNIGALAKTSLKNRAISVNKEDYQNTTEKNQIEKQCSSQRNMNKIFDDNDSEPIMELSRDEVVSVPVLGRVAAGEPIYATENIERTFPLPIDMVKNDDTFMLKVQGESMIEAGILDEDYIVVKRTPVASNGDIVVALIDDDVTVKTFYKEKDYFRLQPQNESMQPIIVTKLTILGKVTGLIRKY